jgi:PAS domain S-box-containing protein
MENIGNKSIKALEDEILIMKNKLKLAEDSLRSIQERKEEAFDPDVPVQSSLLPSSGDFLYRLLVERMSEGAVVINHGLDIIFSNYAFAKFVDQPLQRIIGANLTDFIHIDSVNNLVGLLNLSTSEKSQEPVMLKSPVQDKSFICSFATFNHEGKFYYSLIFTDISEQKSAEIKIEASEKRWRTLVDNIPDNIIQFDKKHRYIYVNAAFEKTTGLKKTDITGLAPRDVFGESESVRTWTENLDKALAENRIIETQEVFSSKEGDKKYFNVLMVPQSDDTGEVTSILTIARDVTEARQYVEHLHELNNKLTAAQELANVGSWDWNLVTNEIRWSEQHYYMWGFNDVSEPISMDIIQERVHPDDREEFESIQKSKTPFTYQHRIIHPSGEIHYLKGRGNVVKDHSGTVVRMFGINHDITEIKEAEQKILTWNKELEAKVEERTSELEILNMELQNLAVRYKTIFETVDEGLFLINADGAIIEANQAGLNLHGFQSFNELNDAVSKYRSKIELMNLDREIIPFEEWPSLRSLKGEIIIGFQGILNDKETKEDKYVAVSSIPVYSKSGNINSVVLSIKDITNIKKNEILLESLLKDLKAANELQENLLYIAAHDFKGPIANFRLLSNLRESYQTAEEKIALFPHVEKIFNQLETTINGLIEILKFQNSSEVFAREIQLNSVVEDLLTSFSGYLEEHDTISFDFDKVTSLTYVPSFLESILKNLVSNAIKYRKKNSPLNIHLESQRVDNYVLVIVKDNGIGIDLEKYKKQLFQPFKRFTRQDTGTGVGLYLVKNLIFRNGGDIVVESKPGEGAAFKCYFKEYV